jgi:hypothetical protein
MSNLTFYQKKKKMSNLTRLYIGLGLARVRIWKGGKQLSLPDLMYY